MKYPVKSARGVYYDLSQSPYEFITPYGEKFKFRSQKRLDMFTRDYEKRIDNIKWYFERVNKVTGWELKMNERVLRDIAEELYEEVMK